MSNPRPVAYYTDALEDFDSSNLEACYYDRDTQTLYVCFLSGSIIAYGNVPSVVWTGLVDAGSKGSYYNREIRGEYKGLGREVKWDDFLRRPLPIVVSQPQKFTITAVTKVTGKVVAPTMEDAIDQFLKDNPGATVTEVTVSFV
jgi:hypothetical protein